MKVVVGQLGEWHSNRRRDRTCENNPLQSSTLSDVAELVATPMQAVIAWPLQSRAQCPSDPRQLPLPSWICRMMRS